MSPRKNMQSVSKFLIVIFLFPVLVTGCSTIKKLFKDCPIVFWNDSASMDSQGRITIRFTLLTCENEPVPNLDDEENQEHITLYEQGNIISKQESKYSIVGVAQAYEFDTILLLDMSGSIVTSEDFPILISSAQDFVVEIAPGKNVAVYTFDGRPGYEIERVVDFTAKVVDLAMGIERLESYVPADISTNLYGAIEEALNILEIRGTQKTDSQLYSASLVVFTDGTHQAGSGRRGYPAFEDIMAQINESYYAVYTIGLGGEVNKQELEALGQAGSVFAKNADDLPDAFDLLVDYANSSYVVTYCSPKRAGSNIFEIKVDWKGMEGIYSYEFDGTKVSPDCTP